MQEGRRVVDEGGREGNVQGEVEDRRGNARLRLQHPDAVHEEVTADDRRVVDDGQLDIWLIRNETQKLPLQHALHQLPAPLLQLKLAQLPPASHGHEELAKSFAGGVAGGKEDDVVGETDLQLLERLSDVCRSFTEDQEGGAGDEVHSLPELIVRSSKSHPAAIASRLKRRRRNVPSTYSSELNAVEAGNNVLFKISVGDRNELGRRKNRVECRHGREGLEGCVHLQEETFAGGHTGFRLVGRGGLEADGIHEPILSRSWGPAEVSGHVADPLGLHRRQDGARRQPRAGGDLDDPVARPQHVGVVKRDHPWPAQPVVRPQRLPACPQDSAERLPDCDPQRRRSGGGGEGGGGREPDRVALEAVFADFQPHAEGGRADGGAGKTS
mmetsp:Transcript_24651/g.55699  ORF Transcript_24651/g.55699 Transcript_24651/m.55699 type:complete len:384 (+) Transcript_24651:217-1368(+)